MKLKVCGNLLEKSLGCNCKLHRHTAISCVCTLRRSLTMSYLYVGPKTGRIPTVLKMKKKKLWVPVLHLLNQSHFAVYWMVIIPVDLCVLDRRSMFFPTYPSCRSLDLFCSIHIIWIKSLVKLVEAHSEYLCWSVKSQVPSIESQLILLGYIYKRFL